jgi:uncharacterized protein involved in high-affinity Fe2+ transport
MNNRLELQAKLVEIIKPLGGRVYWQPAENTKMVYPSINYSLDADDSTFGNNLRYSKFGRYEVQLIINNPEHESIIEEILRLPMSTLENNFVAENLQHYQFTVYY